MSATQRVLVRPILAYCPAGPAALSSSGRPPAVLSAAERRTLEGFSSGKRRRDWLAGRGAVKDAASRWFALRGSPLPQDGFEIVNDDSGRPLLRATAPAGGLPHVSLSHCDAGGFAAAHDGPVGVDWEPVAAREPGVLRYYARPEEDVSTPGAQTALWTVKEAVLKMLGLGLSGGLDNVHWDGRTATLHGAARAAWEQSGEPDFAVDQWIDGEVSLAVAYTEVQR